MKNQIKLVATLAAVISLLATIIATPAMAQDKKTSTVTMPELKIVVKPCKVRALDQGSGNVKICE